MKNKSFLAINLNDFHANQNGEPKTNTEIQFLQAKDIESARELIKRLYPQTAWVVIPKQYFDNNIVYAN
jgi:hypothetical protein